MSPTAPRSDLLAALESEVGALIRRVKRVIVERARVLHPDLPAASYLLLSYLADEGPVRSSVLSERFALDKGAVSRQVQGLEELGLVERTRDPDDGRAWLIGASEDARRRLDEVSTQRRGWLDERLGDWSDADLDQLVAFLARYNRTLD